MWKSSYSSRAWRAMSANRAVAVGSELSHLSPCCHGGPGPTSGREMDNLQVNAYETIPVRAVQKEVKKVGFERVTRKLSPLGVQEGLPEEATFECGEPSRNEP